MGEEKCIRESVEAARRATATILFFVFFFFQAEDGIRDAQETRGLGDVCIRQVRDARTRSLGQWWTSGEGH